jgi:fructose-specific phosphotransferase system IIA component
MIDFLKMIHPDHICEIESQNKKDVLVEMCKMVENDPSVNNPPKFLKAILDREKVMSTGIGMGVAIPHAKTNSVSDFVMAIGRAVNGIDFESLDGLPVHIVILIGAPHSKDQEFLKIIAKIGYLFNSTEFKENFLRASDINEIHKLLTRSFH